MIIRKIRRPVEPQFAPEQWDGGRAWRQEGSQALGVWSLDSRIDLWNAELYLVMSIHPPHQNKLLEWDCEITGIGTRIRWFPFDPERFTRLSDTRRRCSESGLNQTSLPWEADDCVRGSRAFGRGFGGVGSISWFWARGWYKSTWIFENSTWKTPQK